MKKFLSILSAMLFTVGMNVTAFADENETALSNLLGGWLGKFAFVIGVVIALFLVYKIAKNAIEFAKGNGDGSILKILKDVLFLILCIALVFFIANYTNLFDLANKVPTNYAINVIDDLK